MTVVPTLIVTIVGLKPKVPSLFVMILTAFVGPVGAVVGVVPVAVVGVVPVVGALVAVGVGVVPDPVPVLPPQAARRTNAHSASRQHKMYFAVGARFLVVCVFLCIVSSSFYGSLIDIPTW